MQYFGSALTDVGIRKEHNEDSVYLKIVNTKHYGQIAMLVICDGMGGLKKGELASAVVIRRLKEWFDQELPSLLEHFTWQDLAIEWDRMIKSENYKLLEYGAQHRMNLGTTLTAMLIIQEQYMIAHVGDSRVYQIDTNGIRQLTQDQSFVAREVRRGKMTSEEAKTHPKRNLLLQCVGASRTVVPDFLFGKIQSSEVYMLCSDGFRHVLTEEEVYESLNPKKLHTKEDMDMEASELIQIVKGRKERDNISVALVKCTEMGR